MGNELFFTAFLELGTTRPVGFGAALIPWTAIIGYADEIGLVGEQRRDFVEVIRLTDDEFVKMMNAKQKREVNAGKGKKGGG